MSARPGGVSGAEPPSGPASRAAGAFVVAPRVAEAVATGRPVLALESTILTHGLPRPGNLDAAREAESLAGEAGVVPATVGVLDGVVRVGLDEGELERLARIDDPAKLSARDLPLAAATGRSGGTTVAATAHLAHRAGVRVFATGGLGGVHRGASTTFDESADLPALSRLPLVVVSAGVKSVLDVAATLERLETLGIGVVGYRTARFPGFYVTDSGHALEHSVDSPEQVAQAWAAARALGLESALLVANAVPEAEQLDPRVHDEVLARASAALTERGIAGPAATPFLLEFLRAETGMDTLAVNLALYRHNVRVGAAIAEALTHVV